MLEVDLLPAAIAAMDHAGVNPALGSIGEYPLSQLSFAQRDQINFRVMGLSRVETLLSAAALHLIYTNHLIARFVDGATGGHNRTGSSADHGHDDNGH